MTRRKFGPSRGRGRPPLNPDGLPPEILQVRMPEDLRKRLKAAIRKEGVPAAAVIRRALEKELPAPPPIPEPKLPPESAWPEIDPYEAEEPPPAFDPVTGTYRFPGED